MPAEAKRRTTRVKLRRSPAGGDVFDRHGMALAEVAGYLATGGPVERIFSKCMEVVAAAIEAQSMAVYLLDDSGMELSPVAAIGLPVAELHPFPLPADEDIRGWVREHCLEILAHEPRLLCRHKPGYTGPCNALCHPMLYRSEAVGVLAAGRSSKAKAFTASDRALLDAVGQQFAVAAQAGMPREDIMTRERMERSLHIAHNLQRQFQPNHLPDLGGYQVAAAHHSSLEMGGDFYDAICLPNNQVAIVVGETSGHGLDAGFNVARTICEVRGALAEGMGPGDALSAFNRVLVEETRRGCLVSMALAIVDSDTGRFVCTSAGNVHVYTVSPEAAGVRSIERGSETPMGMLTDWEFSEHADAIPAGGALVIHTDGLVGYGSGLEPEVLEECLVRSVKEGELVADSLGECLSLHVGGELGGDDVTVVSINSPV